jgi:hypothetical protein
MFRTHILVALIIFSPAVFAGPQWGLGLGFELRAQREVNPDFAETKGVPQFFAQMQFVNWGAQVEAALEKQSSGSGGLNISSRSANFGGWGRYVFLEQKRWRPFATAGLGCYFDRVKSKFGTAENESSGTRPYVGTGGGVTAVLWRHLLLEAEGRLSLVRERKEPTVSTLLRLGFSFN